MAQSASLLLLGLAGRRSSRNLYLAHTRITSLSFKHNHTQQRALSNSHSINGEDPILPVLIIGAGPVGLALSILLTNLGVKCAVLEKSKVFSTHPQAHFINNRSIEVFRKMDGLAEEILSSQPPVEFWRKFIYCTSLTGPILGSVDHMQPEGTMKGLA
nr:2,4-dichlorophenol 6-monooxygenase isoform X1 [Ipomoea batatas]GME21556.1 2,4-dichlorophenol 6-monooxygenase isoform X1 [Ipomoea batatas]